MPDLFISGGSNAGGAADGGVGVSAAGNSVSAGTVVFSNSNGVSFGMAGSTVTGTVRTNYFALAGSDGDLVGVTLTNTGTVIIGGGGGASVNFVSDNPGNPLIQIQAPVAPLLGVSTGGNTAGATSVLDFQRLVFAGGNNITLSQSNNGLSATVTISGAAAGGGDAIRGIAAGGSTASTNTVNFSNANGVSFGFGAAGNSTVITASYTVPTVTNSSWSISDAATSGTVARLAFTNLNGITLSLSSGVGGSHTIVGSHNALTSQSTNFHAVTLGGNTAGTTTFHATNNRTIWLNGGNNITLSGNGSTVTIVGPTQTVESQSIGMNTSTAGGATGGTSGYASGGQVRYDFYAGSNITLSQSVNGASGSMSIYGTSGGAAAATISSYVNLGVGALYGTTSVQVSQSTSMCVAFQMPQAISASFLRFPVSQTTQTTAIASTASSANASGRLFTTVNAVIYSLGVGASSRSLRSVASGSLGMTQENSVSIATNGSQYSISQFFSAGAEGALTSTSTQYSASSSVLNLSSTFYSAGFTGLAWFDVPFANSLSAGPYWLVLGLSSSSATNSTVLTALTGCRLQYSQHIVVTQADSNFRIMGSTNLTSGGLLGAGSFSTNGGAGTTASIPISAISSSANNPLLYFQLLRSA